MAAASGGDELVAEVWREVLLFADASPDSISYRQDAVRDALRNRDAVLRLYKIANETVDAVQRRVFLFRPHDPVLVVHEAVNGLEVMVSSLRDVLAVLKSAAFSSEAFRQMSKSVLDNINDEFLASAQQLVKILRFEDGVQFSVKIGELNIFENPVLLVPRKGRNNILSKVLRRDEYVYIGWTQEMRRAPVCGLPALLRALAERTLPSLVNIYTIAGGLIGHTPTLCGLRLRLMIFKQMTELFFNGAERVRRRCGVS